MGQTHRAVACRYQPAHPKASSWWTCATTHSRRLRHGPVVPEQRKTLVVVANKQDKIKKRVGTQPGPIRETLSLTRPPPSSPFLPKKKGWGRRELMAVILDHISAHGSCTAQDH